MISDRPCVLALVRDVYYESYKPSGNPLKDDAQLLAPGFVE
jgi:hypothetical protein